MTDSLKTHHDRACAAIAKLAEEAQRIANEHAWAVDRLRAEVASLRKQNAELRALLADVDPDGVQPVDTDAP